MAITTTSPPSPLLAILVMDFAIDAGLEYDVSGLFNTSSKKGGNNGLP